MNALQQASEEDLLAIDAIGPRIAQSVLEFFSEPRYLDLLNSLQEHGLQFEGEGISIRSNVFEEKPSYSPVPFPLFPENRLVNSSKNMVVKLHHQSVKRQIIYWPVMRLVPNEQKQKA